MVTLKDLQSNSVNPITTSQDDEFMTASMPNRLRFSALQGAENAKLSQTTHSALKSLPVETQLVLDASFGLTDNTPRDCETIAATLHTTTDTLITAQETALRYLYRGK